MLKVSMIGIFRKDEYCYWVSRKGILVNVFENRFGNWVCISREDWFFYFLGLRWKVVSVFFWYNFLVILMYLWMGSVVSLIDYM